MISIQGNSYNKISEVLLSYISDTHHGLFWITCFGFKVLHHLIVTHSKYDSQTSSSCSEPDPLKLSRRGCIRLKPNMKDSMVLMQDTLEDQTSLAGGGSGGRRGGKGATLQRRAGSNATQNSFPKQQRYFTARIVVMGDDRVLGRLARAYYLLRLGTHHVTRWGSSLDSSLHCVCARAERI